MQGLSICSQIFVQLSQVHFCLSEVLFDVPDDCAAGLELGESCANYVDMSSMVVHANEGVELIEEVLELAVGDSEILKTFEQRPRRQSELDH